MINPNLTNENKSFMKDHFNNQKLSKDNELNKSMTIKETQPDEYEQKIHQLGGRQ